MLIKSVLSFTLSSFLLSVHFCSAMESGEPGKPYNKESAIIIRAMSEVNMSQGNLIQMQQECIDYVLQENKKASDISENRIEKISIYKNQIEESNKSVTEKYANFVKLYNDEESDIKNVPSIRDFFNRSQKFCGENQIESEESSQEESLQQILQKMSDVEEAKRVITALFKKQSDFVKKQKEMASYVRDVAQLCGLLKTLTEQQDLDINKHKEQISSLKEECSTSEQNEGINATDEQKRATLKNKISNVELSIMCKYVGLCQNNTSTL